MKATTLAAAAAAIATLTAAHADDPRYLCIITPAASCDEQVPGPFISDANTPTQNSFGPFTCTQFWGPGVITASAFSSFGIVGVDIENTWFGCASFGCGPTTLQINSSASHEFDVVFSSPTDEPIDVIMNLYFSGNIQEDPGLYRRVIVRATGPNGNHTGIFGQIDQPDAADIRKGLLSSFDEITGSYVSTPEFTNVPVNIPVRFTMSILVENAQTLVTGGAVNFARGMRLQGIPFTVTGTAPGVSPGDIGINSAGANIHDGEYQSGGCFAADLDTDGLVGLGDLNVVLGNFGQSGAEGDTNGDGEIDLADLNLVLARFGEACS